MRRDIEQTVKSNTGLAMQVKSGQRLQVRGWTIVDLVVFDSANLRERFDQARTKTNQNTLYITVGDVLYSKSNAVLMSIVEDTFDGHHDLQKGMCSRSRHELAFRKKMMRESYTRSVDWDEIPTHGCWENLSSALKPYGVEPEDIPSPFNIFQHMNIDGATGAMTNDPLRPSGPDGACVTLCAEVDCLVAVSACPDLSVGGRDVFVSIDG